MNNVFFIFVLMGLFFSCGKDEEPTCSKSDFIGVWTINDEVCFLNDANTLTISDVSGNDVKAVYSGDRVTSDFPNWTVSNCTVTGKVVQEDFLNINFNGTLSADKKTLTIKNTGSFLGTNVNCTETFTKQ